MFIAEGTRAVEELLRSVLVVRGALVSPQLGTTRRGGAVAARLSERGVETLPVSQAELDSASLTEAPQGILAIAEIPSQPLSKVLLGPTARIVILDAVQDPGNVGTIIRTAAALGAAAVVATPGTVDPWNAKAVRSAMGAGFHLPVPFATWEEIVAFADVHALAIWAADAGGVALDVLPPPARVALILGNEGGGLSHEARKRAHSIVSLPISPSVESLNVAVAAGIFLYQLRA